MTHVIAYAPAGEYAHLSQGWDPSLFAIQVNEAGRNELFNSSTVDRAAATGDVLEVRVLINAPPDDANGAGTNRDVIDALVKAYVHQDRTHEVPVTPVVVVTENVPTGARGTDHNAYEGHVRAHVPSRQGVMTQVSRREPHDVSLYNVRIHVSPDVLGQEFECISAANYTPEFRGQLTALLPAASAVGEVQTLEVGDCTRFVESEYIAAVFDTEIEVFGRVEAADFDLPVTQIRVQRLQSSRLGALPADARLYQLMPATKLTQLGEELTSARNDYSGDEVKLDSRLTFKVPYFSTVSGVTGNAAVFAAGLRSHHLRVQFEDAPSVELGPIANVVLPTRPANPLVPAEMMDPQFMATVTTAMALPEGVTLPAGSDVYVYRIFKHRSLMVIPGIHNVLDTTDGATYVPEGWPCALRVYRRLASSGVVMFPLGLSYVARA